VVRPGVLWTGAFILALVGFANYSAWHRLAYSFWDQLYLALQLVAMNSGAVEPPVPLELNIARFLIPCWPGRRQSSLLGSLPAANPHGAPAAPERAHHYLRLSRKGLLLANRFHERGDAVVVIERDEENDWLEACRTQGMDVLLGDASDATLLRLAGVTRARGLFAVCDDDGMNTEIALRAQELAKEHRGDPLVCLLHVSDPQLCALLRQQEASLERAAFRLELFKRVRTRGAPHAAGTSCLEGRAGEGLVPCWGYNPCRSSDCSQDAAGRPGADGRKPGAARRPRLAQPAAR